MKNKESETISIKQIGLDEFDQFYDVFESNTRKLFPEYKDEAIEIMLKSDSRSALKKKLKAKQVMIITGLVSDKIAACIITDRLHYGGVAELHWLMTSPSHQHKGLASNILKYVDQIFLEQGAHKLKLYADKRNLDFYQKRGYEIVGKIDEHYFGTEDYIMVKTLQKANPKNYLR